MYVYRNAGNTFYLIDYETFQPVREITLDIPGNLYCFSMSLSTNRDYLLFSDVETNSSNQTLFFVVYDIEKEMVHSFFDTGLIKRSTPRFTAAEIPAEPGLFYVYLSNPGIYSFDFLSQEIKELISDEHGFNIHERNNTISKQEVVGGY